MKSRLIPFAVAPAQMQAFVDFSAAMAKDGIEPSLAELIKIRVSQINGCAFCLHMHSRDALAAGESELRLTMLAAWRESPLYSDRERAGLGWAEALTRLPDGTPSDDVYATMAFHFSKEEQVKLTMTISMINAWNRFGAGFHMVHAMPKAAPEKVAA
jgi:AhpD family alkylhydroperoxidase